MVRVKYTEPASAINTEPGSDIYGASRLSAIVQAKGQSKTSQRLSLPSLEHLSISQEQSQEMVQIMLHVSFGTLFYLREFLPLGCFDDRDLKQAQRERKLSYREFIGSKAQSYKLRPSVGPGFGLGKRGQPLKIIVRDADPTADTILDILENGIFDAISKKVLEAVQLTVLVDKEAPANVLESYTFTFRYSGPRRDVGTRLASLSLDPVGCVADMKTTQAARAGLEMIVRRLITLSTFLPALPNKRSLGIHLFYTDDCPRDYEPLGFSASAGDTISYPRNENWRKETQSCGAMDSGFHTVGLNVTALKWTGPELDDPEMLPGIPQDIEYQDKVQRTADIGFANDNNTHNSLELTSDSPREATQDAAEKQRLQMMIPTQITPSQNTSLIPTQPMSPQSVFGNGGRIVGDKSQIVILSPNRASEMFQCVRSDGTEDLAPQNRPIRCQCAWTGEETTIECAFCHSRQHLLCYGFQEPNDPKIPDVHACYQCLLEPNESQLLREMNTLVLLRRALRVILQEGFPNKASILAQKLHCNGSTVIQITDLLKRQGLLQPTFGYKRKGFYQSGLPKYYVPTAKDIHQKMQAEILDPLAKIKHHYFIQRVDEGSDTENVDDNTNCGSYNPHGGRTHVDRNNEIDREASNSDNLTPYNHKRKVGSMDHLHMLASQSSLEVSKDDRIPELPHLGHGVSSDQQAPEPGQVSPEGSIRRSGRKRRRISNYNRLIDVGTRSSSDDNA